jgi:hypothetical protein
MIAGSVKSPDWPRNIDSRIAEQEARAAEAKALHDAAPNLLAACEMMISGKFNTACKMARVAVAKAKGGAA